MEYDGEKHGTPIQLTERFNRFVTFLGEHGGEHQARMDQMAEAIGVPDDAFRRIKTRAVELGVVRVQTNGTVMGIGRFPDSYHLRIKFEDWPRLRQHFAEKWQREKDDRIRKAEARRAATRAQKRIERSRKLVVNPPTRAWPPPPMPPPTPAEELLAEPAVADLDVDAWLEAGDF